MNVRNEDSRVRETRFSWLPVLLLGGAFLYLATIDVHGFWYDEVRTVQDGRRSFRAMLMSRFANGHPPLFFVASWGILRVVGESEVGLRLMPAALGLTSVAVVHRLGARLAGARVGLAAALVLLVSPLQIEISQVARNYTMAQALLLAATLVAVKSDGGWRRAMLFGLLGAFAAWTHFSALLVVGSQIVVLAALRRWRLAGSGLAALAVAAPALVLSRRLTTLRERVLWIGQATEPWTDVFSRPFVDADGWLPPPAVSALAIAMLALGLLGARHVSAGGTLLVATWIGPYVLATIGWLAGGEPLHRVPRYFAPSWAVGALLVVCGISWAARRWPVGALAILASLVALTVADSAAYFLYGAHWPARQVAEIVEAEREESDVLMLHAESDLDFVTLGYHYRRPFYDLSRQGRGRPERRGTPRPEPQSVWIYFRGARPSEGPAAELLRRLERRFPNTEVWPVRRGELVRLARPTTNPGS